MSQEEQDTELTVNDAIAEGLRLGLAQQLGQTGFNAVNSDENPRRNLYEVFGWPRDDLDGWDEENWLALYLRNGYAKVVNDKPAESTWRDDPIIEDTPDQEDTSEFEDAIDRFERNFSPWSYGSRVDRIAGIGQHGLLIIGFDDVANGDDVDLEQWSEPVDESQLNSLDDITTFKPILETQIDSIDWGDPTDGERWGKPISYSIDLSDDIDEETANAPISSFEVHHSRVIDVPATRLLDDETLARPRAEPVLNNLLDLEKTMGAVAEAAFMSANSDLHLNADPEKVDLSQGSDDIRDELMQFFEGQPFLRTQGMDVNQLGGDVQDPSGIVETNLDEIAATTGIPKNELRGNQQGEMSGAEQDAKSYFGMIQERRRQYATPHIVRPLIQRLIDVGVLPTPDGGTFDVEWPDLTQLSELEESKVQVNRAQVLRQAGPLVDIGADYLRDGDIPEQENTQTEPLPSPDEATEGMQAQFAREFGLDANAESLEDLDLTPPQAAQDAAQRALDMAEEHGRDIAMSDTGWNRAEQLAAGEELSPADIADGTDGIANWWARHAPHTLSGGSITSDATLKLEDEDEPWKDASYVAGLGWGGPVMARWATRKKDQIKELRTND